MAKVAGSNIDRDINSINIRKQKKIAKKTTGKGNSAPKFSLEPKKRKNVSYAEKDMILLEENKLNRLFSIRAWDHNGDELWKDDNLSLEQFLKDWNFMQYWALRAKHGEIFQQQRNSPLKGEFFFRRIA